MGKVGFKAAVNDAQTKTKNGAKKNVAPYFKVTENPTVIRFDTLNGDDSLIQFGQHYITFNNGWNRPYSCPDFASEDGERKCIICKSKKGVDVIKNDFTTNYVMRVIEREATVEDKVVDEEGNLVPKLDANGVQVTHTEDVVKYYKFSPFVMTYITAIYEATDDVGDRDYVVHSSKQINEKGQERTVYTFEPVSNKPKSMSAADKALLESAPPLANAEPEYNEEDFNNMKVKEAKTGRGTVNTPLSEDTMNSFFKSNESSEKTTQLDDISKLIAGAGKNKAPQEDEEEDIDISKFLKNYKK